MSEDIPLIQDDEYIQVNERLNIFLAFFFSPKILPKLISIKCWSELDSLRSLKVC